MNDLTTHTLPRAALPADWPAPEALGFGIHLGPLLVTCEHDGERWSAPQVLPRDSTRLALASGGLQYGLSVFEGAKAYRAPDGSMHLFRPQPHAARLIASARRLCLPEISESLFLDTCRLAVQAHQAYVPPHGRGSLYLRPTIHADEESLGLKRASRHRYSITVTPCSDPPLKYLHMWAEPEMIRAAAGGLGAAKTGANYAAGLGGLMRARELGYDDVIWLDAATHQFLGEAGTMNLFVQIGERLLTPPLDGTILAGVTRGSLIEIARMRGITVAQEPISLERLHAAAARGELAGAFGCGTAARIAAIGEIRSPLGNITVQQNPLVQALSAALKSLQEGSAQGMPQWRVPA